MQHTWWRTYLFIWSGQFISMLSSAGVQFAVIIWLSLEYNSAHVLAYAGIFALLPHALIGSFAGVFIDRWDRKKVMILADGFIAFCTLLMTFLMKEGQSHLTLIYFLLACRSIGTAFHAPATQAIVPLIVPQKELLRVAGINQILQSASTIMGPIIGTLAIVALPIHQVLYLDILGASVAIASLFFVRIPKIEINKTEKRSLKVVFDDLKVGLHAIFHNKGLAYLFSMVIGSNLFFMPIVVIYPLLVTQHYGGGKWEMGIVETASGIGMLIGGAILGIFRAKIPKVSLINWMDVIAGVCFVFSGLFPATWFWGFVALTWINGMTFSIFTASFNALLQQIVPPEKLGRVFAIYLSVGNIPSIVGLLGAGLVAQELGVALSTIVAGVFTALIGVVSFMIPALMKVEN